MSSIPDVALVVGNAVFLEEDDEFFLERMLPVVFLLTRDVLRHSSHARFAYAERSITSLPSEVFRRPFFMCPARGIGFDESCDIGNRVRRGHAQQHVNVIGRAIDNQRDTTHGANDATHVGEQIRFDLGLNQRLSVACAEDDVEKDVGTGMGHFLSSLRDLRGGS